jgi:hypothetical protein
MTKAREEEIARIIDPFAIDGNVHPDTLRDLYESHGMTEMEAKSYLRENALQKARTILSLFPLDKGWEPISRMQLIDIMQAYGHKPGHQFIEYVTACNLAHEISEALAAPKGEVG